MPHVFFEPLEKRQSTQTFIPVFPEFRLFYGMQPPTLPTLPTINLEDLSINIDWSMLPTIYPIDGFFPWWRGGIFGASGYSPWINPIDSYNPWGSWRGSSPIWDYLGGLFGGSFTWPWQNNQPAFPDFRLLYGVFPNPQPLYGVGISPAPPTEIITYYGISIPQSVSIFSNF